MVCGMVVLGQFECFDASKTSRSQTFLAHTFRGSSCAVQGFWVLESGQLEAEEWLKGRPTVEHPRCTTPVMALEVQPKRQAIAHPWLCRARCEV